MAGQADLTIKLKVTGLGDDVEVTQLQTLTIPVEILKGYTIVSTATTTAIQLFSDTTKIALDKIYGVYIKAQAGSIYIIVNTAGTDTFTSATADFVLAEGECCFLPINPLSNLGLKIDASAVTDAFSYLILGKA
ncbi:MAG: hypothetical protein PHH82_04565 [Candidatus ainarchaeum sp.]|nr:hypothetical protein [Candidatus ainarchaeum sp.]